MVLCDGSPGSDEILGRMAQRLTAQQENHDDDDEEEADRTAANIERTGKNRSEYKMHMCLSV